MASRKPKTAKKTTKKYYVKGTGTPNAKKMAVVKKAKKGK